MLNICIIKLSHKIKILFRFEEKFSGCALNISESNSLNLHKYIKLYINPLIG